MVSWHIDGEEITSTSPETLVRLQNGRLTTFPVAGSRPRGKTVTEDEQLERELLADEKRAGRAQHAGGSGQKRSGQDFQLRFRGSDPLPDDPQIFENHAYLLRWRATSGRTRMRWMRWRPKARQVPFPERPRSGPARSLKSWSPVPEAFTAGRGAMWISPAIGIRIAIRMAVKKKERNCVSSSPAAVSWRTACRKKEYEESANKAAAVIYAIEHAGEVEE